MDNGTSGRFSGLKNLFKDEKEVNRAGYVAVVILNIILLCIVNNLLNWHISFISSTFQDVLWILNLFLVATIVVNFLYIFYNPSWFRNLLQIFAEVLGLIAAYTLLIVFPFVFNNVFLSYALKFVIVVIMIVFFIGVVIHFIKLISEISTR